MAPGANIHYYASAQLLRRRLPRHARARSSTTTTCSSCRTRGATSRRTRARTTSPPTSRSSCRARSRASASCSPPATTATRSHNTGIKQADYPTSDPYVTGVGGTSTGIDATGNLQFQTGWGTEKYTLSADGQSWTPVGFLYGAGGGTSGAVQPAGLPGRHRPPAAARQVPDVAMDADPNTGMLDRRDADLPGRRVLRRVPHRRHQPGLAAVRRHDRARRCRTPARRRRPAQPDDLRAPGTRSPTCRARRPTPGDVRVDYVNGVDATDGLLYSVRTFNQDSSLHTHARATTRSPGVGAPNTDVADRGLRQHVARPTARLGAPAAHRVGGPSARGRVGRLGSVGVDHAWRCGSASSPCSRCGCSAGAATRCPASSSRSCSRATWPGRWRGCPRASWSSPARTARRRRPRWSRPCWASSYRVLTNDTGSNFVRGAITATVEHASWTRPAALRRRGVRAGRGVGGALRRAWCAPRRGAAAQRHARPARPVRRDRHDGAAARQGRRRDHRARRAQPRRRAHRRARRAARRPTVTYYGVAAGAARAVPERRGALRRPGARVGAAGRASSCRRCPAPGRPADHGAHRRRRPRRRAARRGPAQRAERLRRGGARR